MSQYRRSSLVGVLSRGVTTLIVALVIGCANLSTGTEEDARAGNDSARPAEQSTEDSAATDNSPAAEQSLTDSYVEFMKQAAETDGRTREQMRIEIYRRSENAPLTSRLQLGFLLTSPTETEQHAREGERILREILAGESGLHERVRDLIELRLQEVEVRQALRVELGVVKGKIADLLSIESTMEQKQGESRSRTR